MALTIRKMAATIRYVKKANRINVFLPIDKILLS